MISSVLMRTNIIKVYIRPSSSETKIEGLYNNNIKIKIAAPPEKGKANKELTGLIAKVPGMSKSKIEIVSGITSNYKTIRVNCSSNTDYSKIILDSKSKL